MKTLGIIGGMGPMATAYLLELIIQMTSAKTDQEHLPVVLLNNPRVPDRTAFILDEANPSPLPVLTDMARTLEGLGCGVLCAPCVTSHYFYQELAGCVKVPFLHMVEETARELRAAGKRKAGILATTGTVAAKTYQRMFEKHGMAFAVPDEKHQNMVMQLIYGDIKQGKRADMAVFEAVAAHMRVQGCDGAILGCTELSLIKRDEHLGAFFTDSMEVLCRCAIETFGKTPIGFEED